MIRKLFVLVGISAGALGTSQLPEFAQQYKQRLGGAHGELQRIVTRLDEDAGRVGLSRHQAVYTLQNSDQPLVRQRGTSLGLTVDRFEVLDQQRRQFNELDPLLKPIALFNGVDQELIKDTWQDYQAAIPVTSHGFAWAGAGAIVGWVLFAFMSLPFRTKPKQKVYRKYRQAPRP